MYACETRFTIRVDEKQLLTNERKISQKMHRPVQIQSREYEG